MHPPCPHSQYHNWVSLGESGGGLAGVLLFDSYLFLLSSSLE